MPSTPGIRMSISTTSGSSARAWSCAGLAVPASPTTVMSGSASRISRKPRAQQRLVVDQQHSDRHRPSLSGEPGHAPRSRLRPRADARDVHHRAPRARGCPPDRARPSAARRPAPSPSSSTRDRELVRLVPHGHPGARRGARVPQGVGQRLLDQPVGGQVDAGRQRPRRRPRSTAASAARPRASGRPAAAGRRKPGCGAARPRRRRSRSTPTMLRISAIAVRPVSSIADSASRAPSGSVASTLRARRPAPSSRSRGGRRRRAARGRCAERSSALAARVSASRARSRRPARSRSSAR